MAQSLTPGCDICMKPGCRGECIAPPPLEHWLEMTRPNRWEEGETAPKDGCPHAWVSLVDIDGGDVDVAQTCAACNGQRRQRVQHEPEAPNCYVPGYGWMTI